MPTDCVPKKSLNKFKESRYLQRTPVPDLDSLSGLMHGLNGLSSPDHQAPAPITYKDDPEGHGTDGEAFHRPTDGQRIVLQPTAPSLAEILGQEFGIGCTQLLGHPFTYSTSAASAVAAERPPAEYACWWSSLQRPAHDCNLRQNCIASSAAGSTLDHRDACYRGSPIRHQLCVDSCQLPCRPGVEGGQQTQNTLSQVVSANSRH